MESSREGDVSELGAGECGECSRMDDDGGGCDAVSSQLQYLVVTTADTRYRIYEELNNTGASSSTSKRLYETKATAAVTLSQMFPGSYCSWIDCTV